ncbi:MAG: hypothetical protein HYU68_13360 [Bacteroidetes bacterium]|jgi:hypothetical protein|nr:hypothetical protein [Bacteroidota bacterium]
MLNLNNYIFESNDKDKANHLWTVISEFKFLNKKTIIEHQFVEANNSEINKVIVKCEETTFLKIQDFFKTKFEERGYYLKQIY